MVYSCIYENIVADLVEKSLLLRKKLSSLNDKKLIEACRRQDRRAQRNLYDHYAPHMFGVCKRYVKNKEDAEDVLLEAFFKVFTNIHQFKGDGSFEGWIRRIVINESLMFLRKKHNFHIRVELNQVDAQTPTTVVHKLEAEDILYFMDQLPTGYRTIFNLYVIEGYKHREIAELLGISINTSKSQLILAKKRLRALLEEANYPGVNAK
jgi:RNA polymerase sigma factor (sigma-70 family)